MCIRDRADAWFTTEAAVAAAAIRKIRPNISPCSANVATWGISESVEPLDSVPAWEVPKLGPCSDAESFVGV